MKREPAVALLDVSKSGSLHERNALLPFTSIPFQGLDWRGKGAGKPV